jgi:integrase
MAHNRGSRHEPKWIGYAEYKGARKWVGTHATKEAYRKAHSRCMAELRDQHNRPGRRGRLTVVQFAGATIHEDGRITMTWPDGERCEKAEGRRDSTVRRLRDGLKPFLREYGDRKLDSFTRDEALTWARKQGANTLQAVRQLFNHALDRDLIDRNHFTRVGASKRKRRVDRPDFEIISDDEYKRLRTAARECRSDDYRLILEGAVLAIGEAAMRPGEIFALRYEDLDLPNETICVRRSLDMDTGLVHWPKDDDKRQVPISPTLAAHLARMPRISALVFPAPRGGYMFRSSWSTHWRIISAAAGLPDVEFYDLKHRAIQWMVDPTDEGGLGLDPATVATIVGHDDGGYLIATVYTKLTERRAFERTLKAMRAHGDKPTPPASRTLRLVAAEPHAAPATAAPTRSLA